MTKLREQCIAVIKEALDYICTESEDIQIFAMTSLLTKEAEKTAHLKVQKKQQEEMEKQRAGGIHHHG
jgi:hypothetical protein